MQSVMKLVVGMAVLDEVDRGTIRLNESIVVTRDDVSVGHQPILERVGAKGYRTTIAELIERSVQQSDSLAVDKLIARLGGVSKVQGFLKRNGISGVRVDRTERQLQSDVEGLPWRADFLDPDLRDRALEKVSAANRIAAWKGHQVDTEDTSTPAGMARLLAKLDAGELLSKSSTEWLLKTMRGTTTYPTRLKAGVPKGWTFGHKTGSSGDFRGIAVATNDVGIATSPRGQRVILVGFLSNSKLGDDARDKVLADASAIVFRHIRRSR